MGDAQGCSHSNSERGGCFAGNSRGVELKNPGSGFEHHFKPSAQAGMGAKPTTGTAGAAGIANPWLEGSINLTRQMALEATDPDLAAVLKREAGK